MLTAATKLACRERLRVNVRRHCSISPAALEALRAHLRAEVVEGVDEGEMPEATVAAMRTQLGMS